MKRPSIYRRRYFAVFRSFEAAVQSVNFAPGSQDRQMSSVHGQGFTKFLLPPSIPKLPPTSDSISNSVALIFGLFHHRETRSSLARDLLISTPSAKRKRWTSSFGSVKSRVILAWFSLTPVFPSFSNRGRRSTAEQWNIPMNISFRLLYSLGNTDWYGEISISLFVKSIPNYAQIRFLSLL